MVGRQARRARRIGAGHVVVIGAGFAGLLAARVLSEHAERVTLVERDRLPAEPDVRPGVPQGRHVHALLESGQRALEELLPGVLAELDGHGAPRLGMPDELLYWQDGRWYRRTPASTHVYTGRRAQVEWLVRRRVCADGRVTVVGGTEVRGLLGDASRVRGVLLRERGAGAEGTSQPLAADLVVDASGRGSRAPVWLVALGAEAPREERLDTGLAYATRVYRATEEGAPEAPRGYYLLPSPEQTRSGVVVPVGDDLHLVTLSGLRDYQPPTDPAEFEAFAQRLPHPVIGDWMARAKPESGVFGFRGTVNVRLRYDRRGRRPEGFLATGDALCAFNPIYGQGMSVAALNALALRDALANPHRSSRTLNVQRAVARSSRQAWDISTGADRNMPGAEGDVARGGMADRVASWYLGRVQARAPGDPVVGDAFRAVLGLTAPLSALFAPAVARAALFGRVRETPDGPPPRPEA
ncbi:FAD-dependent monooxygenase [Streptomyces sp. B6B3]|uniref:NAD(P)/FAD-dependent oxidoreductase n=1 Tax=Streptomyces sp. B6B3 TaxID=3153570 RepID=UPI00325C952D